MIKKYKNISSFYIEKYIFHNILYNILFFKKNINNILFIGIGEKKKYFINKIKNIISNANIYNITIDNIIKKCNNNTFKKVNLFDLVILDSSFYISNEKSLLLNKIFYVMKKNSIILFFSLGEETLKEFNNIYYLKYNKYLKYYPSNIKNISYLLSKNLFSDIVINSKNLIFFYKSIKKCLNDLKNLGIYNIEKDCSLNNINNNILQIYKKKYLYKSNIFL